MNTQPQTLKGFRDFLPEEKLKRDWVRGKIIKAFERSGFVPLETPTLEYRDVIMGKYGEEADKLVYQFTDNGGREIALRYDQTVPLTRVIAQNRFALPIPFRRYQIQNVFRADKPQKGRYREFTQCDIDILGSNSALADAEILATTYAALKNIGLNDAQLRVNDRQVLFAALEKYATEQVSVPQIIQSIDKLDKMTTDAVVAELMRKGLSPVNAQAALDAVLSAQPSADLTRIMEVTQQLGVPADALVFSPAIARGLDYYTGMIFEIVSPSFGSGSLGGGGRYDRLIAELGGVDMPAVGVGLGFDRIVEAADTLGLIPESVLSGAQALVTVFSDEMLSASVELVAKLRENNVRTELFVGDAKLGKQLAYANKANIPWVVVIGPDESAQGQIQLKNMISGAQETCKIQRALEQITNAA